MKRPLLLFLSSAVLACAACWVVAAQSGNLTLARLEADASPQPLGIDDRSPRLSWALVGGGRGVMQKAVRVLVASKPELAREGRADIWDSGRVTSSEPWVVYAGPALKSRTRYYWTAAVWFTRWAQATINFASQTSRGASNP